MSTSLLYHAFSIRGYEYVRTEYQAGNVVFTIQQAPKTFRCEACGSRDVRPRGQVERRFRAMSGATKRLPDQDRNAKVRMRLPYGFSQVGRHERRPSDLTAEATTR